jgi:hypothetical protein
MARLHVGPRPALERFVRPDHVASRLLHVLHRLMRPDPGRLVAFALTLGRLLVPDDTEPLASAPVSSNVIRRAPASTATSVADTDMR